MSQACLYGRLPGPLGADLPLAEFALAAAAGAARRPLAPAKDTIQLFEPEPTSGWTSELRMSDFSLSPLISDDPQLADVRQGATGNCPLIATLAALAHARPRSIRKMVRRLRAEVSTRTIDTNYTTPEYQDFHYWSPYAFEVKFADGEPIVVSGYLWNRGGEVEFGRSARGDLWPSILEKAYVFAHGGNSYGRVFGALIPYEVMTTVLGRCDELIVRGLDNSQLTAMLSQAGNRPTIADTYNELPPDIEVPDGIIGFHTYAVRGISGANARVYNPLTGDTINIGLTRFRRVFNSVVQAH